MVSPVGGGLGLKNSSILDCDVASCDVDLVEGGFLKVLTGVRRELLTS